VASDAQGNIYVVGAFEETMQPTGGSSVSSIAGSHDTFVVKYNSSGAHVWTKVLGGAGSFDADDSQVAVDHQGNVIVAGEYYGSIQLNGTTYYPEDWHDIFVTKLDPSGNYLWAKVFPGNVEERIYGIAIDANNSIILTGAFAITPQTFPPQPQIGGHVDFGNGTAVLGNVAPSGFITKLSATGVTQWSRQIGDVQSFVERTAGSPVVDSQLNITVVATHEGTVESMGQQFPAGSYLYRFTPSGTLNFVKALGVTGSACCAGWAFPSVALTPSGNYIWAGDFDAPVDLGFGTLTPEGATDIAIGAWTSGGVPIAAGQVGGGGGVNVSGLQVDPVGNVIVAGWFTGTLGANGNTVTSTNGFVDGFIAKLDKSLTLGWIKKVNLGSSNGAPLRDLAVDPAGNSFVAGEFLQTLQIGSASFVAVTGVDGFLVGFGP
jgi:hypothetical protein